MIKDEQWSRNPFLRAATGSDSVADIRNGHIVDFGFYQSRFALQAPQAIVWALGTNDVRDRSEAEINNAVRSNAALIYRRLKAAWPAAKIIRTLPGTAMDIAREELWTKEYVPVLRAAFDAIADVGGGVTVAPCWALVNHEAGYSWTSAPDATTGFSRFAGWTDAVHPVGTARIAMYTALAPYVAAAGLNLI